MYDLIIIGGGPSGSSAARIAGKSNLDTLLIEKESFPRYKPCGGGLSEQAMSYLDFAVPDHILERNVYGARVHYRNWKIEQQKKYRIAATVSRSVFDGYLLHKAEETKIKVNYSEKVLDIIEHQSHVDVISDKDTYRAKFAIIAEGSSGKLKNTIRRKDRENEFAVCAVTEIPASNQEIDGYIYDSIDIHFGIANLGYGWVFPHERYFSVGIGGLAQDMSQPKKVLAEFLTHNGFNEFDVDDFKVHTIPAGGIKRKLYGNRTILVGDSGGHADSFLGEGIAYAIRSGQIAAEVILRNLNDNAKVDLHSYKDRCQKEFGDNLRYSLILSKLMHKFPNVFFRILASQSTVLNKYLEVPAKRISYKEYIKWLVPRVPVLLVSRSK
ncbi:MAG: geranylgeranyl reductase family protein [Ardenticatenales bacterium]|nr:geranylgeranyl reductase family protein [Ardenticatenales bacterium]